MCAKMFPGSPKGLEVAWMGKNLTLNFKIMNLTAYTDKPFTGL